MTESFIEPLDPHEVEQLLATYRAHRRPLAEECSCGEEHCRLGSLARNRLWRAGINPEHPK